MRLLYNTGLSIYFGGIALAANFNRKAELFVKGRRGWEKSLREKIDFARSQGRSEVVWVHCSSAGEFEQGRTIIDAAKHNNPHVIILLTFFSPSGYELRKNYPNADLVFYLPLDSPKNAEKFLDIVRPSKALFIKYEFWYNYLKALKVREIPTYVVSAIFREKQVFFRWYGGLFRQMLMYFTKILVQEENSVKLLEGLGLSNCVVTGDTRFDRVNELKKSSVSVPAAEVFVKESFCLVAGSTWEPDEKIIGGVMSDMGDIKLIIAPHEIKDEQIAHLKSVLDPLGVVIFSQIKDRVGEEGVQEMLRKSRVLIIDTVGLLSSLYRYAHVAYIGGGFGKGIHNILEAATFGVPVIFGPNYHRFREANDLIALGGAFQVECAADLKSLIKGYESDSSLLRNTGIICGNYVEENRGATAKVFREIF